MKTETTRQAHGRLTDKDREAVLKLITCGLPTKEIADIMHISTSTVSYIRQAHTACLNRDWSTLQRLSLDSSATTEWAMRITGTDKVFAETFPKEDEPESVTGPTVDNTPNTIDPRNLYEMYEVLTDIRSLLTEIRDMLK